MKRLILPALGVGVLLTVLIAGVLETQEPSVVEAANRTVTLSVENMFCALCPLTAQISLEKVDGVEEAIVSYEEATATVTFDETQTDTEKLTAATTLAGYPSTVLTTESGS